MACADDDAKANAKATAISLIIVSLPSIRKEFLSIASLAVEQNDSDHKMIQINEGCRRHV
jgi:hypothetical protein